MDHNINILDDLRITPIDRNRRDLLPNWIKAFIWIFLIVGIFGIVDVLMHTSDAPFHLSLYGIETYQLFSTMGIPLFLLFIFKFIVALGLLTEKNWAVDCAIVDATLGIIIVLFIMLVLPFMEEIDIIRPSVRLEIIPLTFYLITMYQIKPAWDRLKP